MAYKRRVEEKRRIAQLNRYDFCRQEERWF